MKIFVHSATECFTDCLPHGEGLIFYEYLKALISKDVSFRGYAEKVTLKEQLERVDIREAPSDFFFRSFSKFRYNRYIDIELKRLCKNGHSFDLVWRGNPMGTMCPIAPRTGKIPLVIGPLFKKWSAQNKPQRKLPIRPAHLSQKLAYSGWLQALKKARLVLVTSPNLGFSEAEQSIINEKSLEIPIIIDPPKELDANQKSNNTFSIAWIGALEERKYPLMALDAFKEAYAHCNRLRLIIIGKGNLRARLENEVATHNLTEVVDIRGRLDNRAVWDELSKSHVLLSTAHGEPYGRAILEGIAAGCIPIVHNSGGPAEFLTDGKDALLLNQHRASDYAAAILRIVQSTQFAQHLQLNGSRTISAYSSQKVSQRLYDAFSAII